MTFRGTLIDSLESFTCCICGERFYAPRGCGNNPYPLGKNENDMCCDQCNIDFVLPARIELIRRS